MTENMGWIGVDLDGTLAYYDGNWRGGYKIGEPIPKMVKKVKELLRQGKTVRIFTARIAENSLPYGIKTTNEMTALIQDWCTKHIGQRLEVVNTKDCFMEVFYDDRAKQVVSNEGVLVEDLLKTYYEYYKNHKELKK